MVLARTGEDAQRYESTRIPAPFEAFETLVDDVETFFIECQLIVKVSV